MEALFELIKSLLYIIVFIPYYFIAFGVVMYAINTMHIDSERTDQEIFRSPLLW